LKCSLLDLHSGLLGTSHGLVGKELLEGLHGGLGAGALLSVGGGKSLLAGADLSSGLLALGGSGGLLGLGRSELGNLGAHGGGNDLLDL